jgi:hypothetical protein
MDRARARKHDKDLSNCLTGQAVGLRSHDAVLTVIGLQNAGKLPDCGTLTWEQVIDLAGARDAEAGTVILIPDHDYVCEDPAAPVNLADEMPAAGLMWPED